MTIDTRKSIAELDLSVRTRNALIVAGIITIDQLLQKTERDLMAITNFGDKSMDDVIDGLDAHGLALPGEKPSIPGPGEYVVKFSHWMILDDAGFVHLTSVCDFCGSTIRDVPGGLPDHAKSHVPAAPAASSPNRSPKRKETQTPCSAN